MSPRAPETLSCRGRGEGRRAGETGVGGGRFRKRVKIWVYINIFKAV